jgi:hypothetical protein
MLTKKLREIREQAKACHRALVELEARAGIAEKAERLRTEPANYIGIYDAAEFWSDDLTNLTRAEEAFHEKRMTHRLRDLYFAVDDVELRKKLIAKAREEGSINLSYFQQELADAATRLEAARSAHQHWSVWASIWGALFIAGGHHFFGLPGALGGLLLGFFNGWSLRDRAVRLREGDIVEAERELKEAEDTWNRIRNEPQTFSQREANTGEPAPRLREA